MSLEFGEHLRALREFTTEFSQAEIAEILRIDRSTYTNYELDKTKPSISTLLELCKIFDISCDELINPEFYNIKSRKGNTDMETMTKSERQVMKLLWSSDKPLSCSEIVEMSSDKTWKDSYVHSLIKSLMKKEIVKIESFELISRSYARKFAPQISYDEYILLSGFSKEELRDPKRMASLINTILDYTDADQLKKAVREIAQH